MQIPVSLAPSLSYISLSTNFDAHLNVFIAADDVSKLLKEVGATADKDSIDNMIKALKGKKLHDLVRDGSSKLATIAPAAAAGKLLTHNESGLTCLV